MTDTSDPAAIDIASAVARHFAEQAEHNRRAEALCPANKAALFDVLAGARITHVVVIFDGCGDSGQVEDIAAHAGDAAVALPEAQITICSPVWGSDEMECRQVGVEAAIEQFAYDLLAETHAGWENNDGAHGEFSFDVAKRTISLDYHERFTSSEYYGHEF